MEFACKCRFFGTTDKIWLLVSIDLYASIDRVYCTYNHICAFPHHCDRVFYWTHSMGMNHYQNRKPWWIWRLACKRRPVQSLAIRPSSLVSESTDVQPVQDITLRVKHNILPTLLPNKMTIYNEWDSNKTNRPIYFVHYTDAKPSSVVLGNYE